MSVSPTYQLRIAAEAARIPSAKPRRYIDMNITPLRANDVGAAGSGSRIGLSRNRVLQIAITEVLLKSGVSLSRAAKAALVFSDHSNSGREAGQLYKQGKTILVVCNESATVRNVDFSANIFDLLNDGVVIVADCNKVVADVDAVLDNSPSN